MKVLSFAEIKGQIHKFANGIENAPSQAVRLFVYSVDHAVQHGNVTLVKDLHDRSPKKYREAYQEAAQVLGFTIVPADKNNSETYLRGLKRGKDLGVVFRRLMEMAARKVSIESAEFKNTFRPAAAEKAEVSKAKREAAKAEAEAAAKELEELRSKVETMGGNRSIADMFRELSFADQAAVLAELVAIHNANANAEADAQAA